MAWGSEWKTEPVWPTGFETGKLKAEDIGKTLKINIPSEEYKNLTVKQEENTTIIYPATPEFPAKKFDGMVTVDLDKDGNVTKEGKNKILKDIKNKFPTHDPYTNPKAFLYYECDCGNRFDPHVKSFSALNNAAMNSDWKIRWGRESYVPYCPKCVVEKGIE